MFFTIKSGGSRGGTTCNQRRRFPGFLPLLFIAAFAFCGFPALALDFADVKMLVENQVPETVIMQMAANQGDMGLTKSEADELRRSGASENLLSSLGIHPESAEPTVSTPSPYTINDVPLDRGPFVTAGTPVLQSTGLPPDGSPIMPLDITTTSAFPPLYQKQGWLSISNRDWQPYHLIVDEQKKRMFLSRSPNGGKFLNPGENVVLNLRRNGYKLYGDTGEKLEVKIRENLTTTLSLEPFGVFGNSGLTGVANDRGKVRSEVLFAPFVPVQRIIVEPAPVIVAPPPVIVAPPPPPVRYYYGRPRNYYWYR